MLSVSAVSAVFNLEKNTILVDLSELGCLEGYLLTNSRLLEAALSHNALEYTSKFQNSLVFGYLINRGGAGSQRQNERNIVVGEGPRWRRPLPWKWSVPCLNSVSALHFQPARGVD
jgi:hypothetical protein